jgi:hypothetical protein
MKIDLYGMTFDVPGVSFHLWSPWRCSALEHRLFETIKSLPGLTVEQAADEWRVNIVDAQLFKLATQIVERILKGWQEEASDAGTDCDAHGFDHNGEPACVWGFVRVTLERGSPEGDRAEDIDLNGFGLRMWRAEEKNP